MKKTVYICSNGDLKRKQNTLFFENKDGTKKYIPIEDTNELMIFGEVSVNKKFLEFASQKEIILHFFNYYGYYIGSYYPREHYNSGYMILKQAEYYMDKEKRLLIARLFISGAIKNILKILMYYNRREKDLSRSIEKISSLLESLNNQKSIEQIMAIEGNVRQVYYNSFDIIIGNENFIFEKRTKQPPRNQLNSLISFANSLIYTYVLSEIYQTHLDPRLGFLHESNFRRFSLNLDVSEIFKPVIADRVIFSIVNKNMLNNKHFEKKLNGIVLNDKGRSIFIQEMDKKLKTTVKYKSMDKEVSYRRLIRLELYKIEKHLLGEEEYKPFIMEW